MDVRRQLAALRPSRLLAVALVLVGAYLFANNLTPRPRYVVPTEAKFIHREHYRDPNHWGSVAEVSNDGGRVIIGTHRGDFSRLTRSSRWEVRDVRSDVDQTPVHWNDPDWQRLMSERLTKSDVGSGLPNLLAEPSGRDFLHDAAAWAALRERLTIARARHVDDLRQSGRQISDEETDSSPFPSSLRISRDGRFVSYTRYGWPVHLRTGDGTAIEECRTGRRVALLPGETGEVVIAPDSQSAVTGDIVPGWELGLYVLEGDRPPPSLTVWDLETTTRRAELPLPHPFSKCEFSPDGRYLFGQCGPLLYWWDTATWRQVGETGGVWHRKFLDGGRMLVTQSQDHQVLHFRDVLAGRQLDVWEPVIGTGRIGRLLSAGGDRHLAAEFNDDPDPAARKSFPLVDRVIDWLPDGPPTDRSRVVVLDVIDRRVSGPVPGRAAALSADGQWLATLDADGVVRVWPVPLGRPWFRSFVCAAAVVLGGWGVWRLLGRVRRRLWPQAE